MAIDDKVSPDVEPVRLLIWDLDECFWHGTLTEGGITPRQDTVEIVKELARRGIISTICSKNDADQVRSILIDLGVSEYFVLPSINWDPKGPRVIDLIDTFQLRPATVMFIDDNPMNLAEVQSLCPGVQVRSDKFIGQILTHPLFKGKDDHELSRLKQYKMLEQRKSDQIKLGSDITEFLRQSDIRVRLVVDFTAHMDRAVELINRTNQLNFTKQRLPDDHAAALASLKAQLVSHEIRAGLVEVKDKYGNHGICGLYILHNRGELLQFTFSCRVLGMGVERWLYHRLGRPHIRVNGEVLVNLHENTGPVDWITLETQGSVATTPSGEPPFERLVARGGCDLQAVSHYFSVMVREGLGEYNLNQYGLDARIDHSCFLAPQAKNVLSQEILEAAQKLIYQPAHFQSALFRDQRDKEVWLLSFWTDAAYSVYKHHTLDFMVPFAFPHYNVKDIRHIADANIPPHLNAPKIRSAIQTLRENYEYVGLISQHDYQDNLRAILSAAHHNQRIFILTPSEYYKPTHLWWPLSHCEQLNRWTVEVTVQFPNVTLINIRDFVQSETEVIDQFHFDRLVYFRIFQYIQRACVTGDYRPPSPGWALHLHADPLGILAGSHDTESMARTAWALNLAGRNDEALELAQTATKLAPNDLSYQIVAARTSLALGRKFDSAGLREAARSVPLDQQCRDIVAYILTQNDELAEAAAFRAMAS